jgi:DNA-binding transcriptional LysR family regulator
MLLDPNDLLLFARVVEDASFSRAADRFGIPKSTLSRRITQLESQLGERLLLRTTRKLTLTDFGRAVLSHAQQVAAEVEAATAIGQHRQAEPAGRLRISIPGDFATDVLSPLLADFIANHPAISLEVDISPRRVDLIGENFDLAIRMGDLQDDASLAARRIAIMTTGLYAAPKYLKQHGTPSEPEALMEHDALHLLGRTGEPARWLLSRDNIRWEGAPPARATANSPGLLLRLALAGAGIAMLSDHFVASQVQSGALVRVLEDWDSPGVPAWAVFPGRRLMPARTRVFLDALTQSFDRECENVRKAESKKPADAGSS